MNLCNVAKKNREDIRARGFSEIEHFTKECRVMNNLIQAVNLRYNTKFPHIGKGRWTQYLNVFSDAWPGDESERTYPIFFEDCDVRSIPSVVDASLSYKTELIGMWFVPSWMTDIVGLIGPAVYKRNVELAHWDEAVDAFHAGLQGDLDAVGAFIGGMILMAEAKGGL